MNTRITGAIAIAIVAATTLAGCSSETIEAPGKASETGITAEDEGSSPSTGTTKETRVSGELISTSDAGVDANFASTVPAGWKHYAYSEDLFAMASPVAPEENVSITESGEGDGTFNQYVAYEPGTEYSVVVLRSTLLPNNETEEIGRAKSVQEKLFSGSTDFLEKESGTVKQIAGKTGYFYAGTSKADDGSTVYIDSLAVFRGSNMYVVMTASTDSSKFDKFAKGFQMIDKN